MITNNYLKESESGVKYVDRIEETKRLTKLFDEMEKSTVFFMYSKTGVGKSSISQKFIEYITSDGEIAPVKVMTNRINKTDNTFEGQYLIDIFRTISNLFKENRKLSFSSYIKKSKNKAHKKYIFEKILSEAQNSSTIKTLLLKLPAFWILKRILKLNEFNCENFANDYSIQSLQLINSYVEFVLEKQRLILVVDNIQNIDKKTIQYITDWLSRYKEKRHLFLFEYTLEKENDRINVLEYRDYFQNLDISIKLFEVKNLNEEYAIEAALTNAQEGICETIYIPEEAAEYYKSIDGNIRTLEDFIRRYNINAEHNISYTPTLDNIKSLDKNSLFVFCLICLNETKINRFELESMVKDKSIDLSNTLKQLSDIHKLIVLEENEITISHASVFDCWKTSSAKNIQRSNILAYNAMELHYKKLLDNYEKTNIHKAFIMLLKLYIQFEPNKIFDLLNEFDILAVEFVSPEKLKQYILAIDEELSENVNDFVDFYFKLIDICLEVGLYELAGDLLKKIENSASLYKYLFYKCNYMVKSENHEKNILFINKIIGGIENELLILFLKLFLIISYRSTNNYNLVKYTENEIERYIQDKNLENIDLFLAFYLRLSELRKNRTDAIQDVEKSIELFSNLNYEKQVAKTRVALSFLYAVTGKTNDAIEQSDKAEKVIVKNFINQHVFFNNKAAIYLLNGNYGNEVWNILEKADFTAQGTFDKLAICNNKLAYSVQIKDYSKSKICANQMLRLLNIEKDKHICAISYYNLYYYYNWIGDSTKADEFLSKSKKLKKHCKTLNARLNNTSTGDGTDILISKPWHVCFLDYWDIDYFDVFD